MFVVWTVLALVWPPASAQDAVPVVVAGELARDDPGAVYVDRSGGLYDLDPAFEERVCDMIRAELDCEGFGVAFVSPPPALPAAVALAALPDHVALRLLRLGAAACLIGGFVALWERLRARSPRAPQLLALTAVAITPLALVPIDLGQTSSLMFLSAALGVVAVDRRGWPRALLVGVLVLVISFKLLPVALLAVLALQRRWRPLVATVACLAVLGVAGLALAGGPSLVGDYLDASAAVGSQTAQNPYNGSLDAAAYRAADGGLSPEQATQLGNAVRLLAVPVLAWMCWRLRRDDDQWAFAWAALVVLAPLAWWHYSLASVAAVGVALGGRARSDRTMAVLPALVVVGMPLSIVTDRGWLLPLAQGAWALGALVAVTWLAGGHRSPRPSGDELSVPPGTIG